MVTALVDTSGYRLFDEKEPFNSAFKIAYRFSTKDESLSCTSNLHPLSAEFRLESPSRHVLYDLLEHIVKEREQDGKQFPLFSFKGDFIYFASHRFAMPILYFLRTMLLKIGPESVKEMTILSQEYLHQRDRDYPDSKVKQRVFLDAYQRKLETELVKAGFMDQKLSLVGYTKMD